jgi:hypothetical protein
MEQDEPEKPANLVAFEPAGERLVAPDHPPKDQRIADESPVGLIVTEEPGLARPTPDKTAYLVFCNGDDKDSRKAYESLRTMAGQQVKITGQVLNEAASGHPPPPTGARTSQRRFNGYRQE